MILSCETADEVACYDKCLLIGKADSLACLDGVYCWRESGEANHCCKHHVYRLCLHYLVESLCSGIHLDIWQVGKQQLQCFVVGFVGYDNGSRAELACLFSKHLIAVVGCETVHLVAVAMLFYYVECLGSD